jgi:hypothetical protein
MAPRATPVTGSDKKPARTHCQFRHTFCSRRHPGIERRESAATAVLSRFAARKLLFPGHAQLRAGGPPDRDLRRFASIVPRCAAV